MILLLFLQFSYIKLVLSSVSRVNIAYTWDWINRATIPYRIMVIRINSKVTVANSFINQIQKFESCIEVPGFLFLIFLWLVFEVIQAYEGCNDSNSLRNLFNCTISLPEYHIIFWYYHLLEVAGYETAKRFTTDLFSKNVTK